MHIEQADLHHFDSQPRGIRRLLDRFTRRAGQTLTRRGQQFIERHPRHAGPQLRFGQQADRTFGIGRGQGKRPHVANAVLHFGRQFEGDFIGDQQQPVIRHEAFFVAMFGLPFNHRRIGPGKTGGSRAVRPNRHLPQFSRTQPDHRLKGTRPSPPPAILRDLAEPSISQNHRLFVRPQKHDVRAEPARDQSRQRDLPDSSRLARQGRDDPTRSQAFGRPVQPAIRRDESPPPSGRPPVIHPQQAERIDHHRERRHLVKQRPAHRVEPAYRREQHSQPVEPKCKQVDALPDDRHQ